MGSAQRSHKAWVRKHQPSYWEVWFGKKKKDKKNGCDVDSVRAQHGSPAQGNFQGNQGSPHGQGPVFPEQGGFPRGPPGGLDHAYQNGPGDFRIPPDGGSPFPNGHPGMNGFDPGSPLRGGAGTKNSSLLVGHSGKNESAIGSPQVRGSGGNVYSSPPTGHPALGGFAPNSPHEGRVGGSMYSAFPTGHPGRDRCAPGSQQVRSGGGNMHSSFPTGHPARNEPAPPERSGGGNMYSTFPTGHPGKI